MEETIYPTNPKKYTGGITKTQSNTYRVQIRKGDVYFVKNVKTFEDALELLREKNIEFELPIKNLIHPIKDENGQINHYEMDLTQGKKCKFDEADMEIAQNYTWCYHKIRDDQEYVNTIIEGKSKKIHAFILPHKKLTADHIDRNGLDNRRSNLRLATKAEQNINRKVRSNTGIQGVRLERLNGYRASFNDTDGKYKCKYFSIKEHGKEEAKRLAIEWRKEKTKDIEKYRVLDEIDE